jgi:hypothetical protein
MTLRGNYHFLFGTQLACGILTWFACLKFGLYGIIIGFIPFLFGLAAVHYKHETDERELALVHKIDSYQSICAGVIAGVIYVFFPQINWFFALVAGISIVRGIIGLITFSVC